MMLEEKILVCDITKYGKQSDPIEGSRFFHWYCNRCGKPMRVTMKAGIPGATECEQCNPHRPPLGSYGPYKDDTSPSWDNAVRALEN